MNVSFDINPPLPYPDFIYEGTTEAEVENSWADKGGKRGAAIGGVGLAGFVFAAISTGPIGAAVVAGGYVLGQLTHFGATWLIDKEKCSELEKTCENIHAYNMDRIQSVDNLARMFLGMLGQKTFYPSNTKSIALQKLTENGPSGQLLDITPIFSYYKKVRLLREEIYSDKVKDVARVAQLVFKAIQEVTDLKNKYSEELNIPLESLDLAKGTSLKQIPLFSYPTFTLPQHCEPMVSKEGSESYFRNMKDIQSFANTVIEVAGHKLPDLRDLRSLSDRAINQGDKSLAGRLEVQIFNTLFQTAVYAIQKNWSDLEALRSIMVTQQLSGKLKKLEKKVTQLQNSPSSTTIDDAHDLSNRVTKLEQNLAGLANTIFEEISKTD